MRGVDYRAPRTGITLLVTRPFYNFRDAEQALLRVGRFGDKCYRFRLRGFDLVDPLSASNSYA